MKASSLAPSLVGVFLDLPCGLCFPLLGEGEGVHALRPQLLLKKPGNISSVRKISQPTPSPTQGSSSVNGNNVT